LQDFDGLGFKHFYSGGLSVLQQIFAIDEAHYPEGLHRMYVANAPTIASMFYKALKPFVDPVTLAKVQIISSREEFIKAVSEDVDLENIPCFLGGSCTCRMSPCIQGGGPFLLEQ